MDNDYTHSYNNNGGNDITRTQPQQPSVGNRPPFRQAPPMPPQGYGPGRPPVQRPNQYHRPSQPNPRPNKGISPIAIIAITVAGLAIVVVLFIFVIKPLIWGDNNRTIDRNIHDERTLDNNSSATTEAVNSSNNIFNQIEQNMVSINGGTFTMGATYEQSDMAMNREYPAHSVTVSNFKISKYEVTQEQWKAVMSDNPSVNIGDNRPVDNVSWNDCQRFISRLNELTGKNYRLPTEAEWEFAARGGNNSQNYIYSGSDYAESVAWHSGNSGNTTHDVGQLQPNELGLYDMSGNVFEWCSDFFGDYTYNEQYDPTGPGSNSSNQHVGRGGGYNLGQKLCRVSGRTPGKAGYRSNSLGLRLAHD